MKNKTEHVVYKTYSLKPKTQNVPLTKEEVRRQLGWDMLQASAKVLK